MITSRQISVDPGILSIIIDENADTLFVNSNRNGYSVITRLNLNEPELAPFDTLTLPEPAVAGIIDPRVEKNQLIYYNSLGTTLYLVSVSST